MSIRDELEKLVDKCGDKAVGYLSGQEDMIEEIAQAEKAILAEVELIIGKEKEYANSNKAPEDSRDYEPAFVEGWNACQENIKAKLEKE